LLKKNGIVVVGTNWRRDIHINFNHELWLNFSVLWNI